MEAACCRDNVLFMAISGNSAAALQHARQVREQPGRRPLARSSPRCWRSAIARGLIGRQMFAIDGVKLPSNASKAKSGKRKDFVRQAAKMEKAVEQILAKQRSGRCERKRSRAAERKEQRRLERLQAEAAKLREWLKEHPQDRKSAKGGPRCRIAPTTSRPRCPPTRA